MSGFSDEYTWAASQVARILQSRPYCAAVEKPHPQESEEEEEEEDNGKLFDLVPPEEAKGAERSVTLEDVGTSPEQEREQNDAVVRACVNAIFRLGSEASNTYDAAELGTTTIFKGVIFGFQDVPVEIHESLACMNKHLGVQNDPNDCLRVHYRRPVLVRLCQTGELVLVEDAVSFWVDDDSPS